MSIKRDIRLFKSVPENETNRHNQNIFDVLTNEKNLTLQELKSKTKTDEDYLHRYLDRCMSRNVIEMSDLGESDIIRLKKMDKNILGVGFGNNECVLTVIDLNGIILKNEVIKIPSLNKLKGKNKEINGILDLIKANTRLKNIPFYISCVSVPLLMTGMPRKLTDTFTAGISHIFNCDVLYVREEVASGYGEKSVNNDVKEKEVLYVHSDIGAGVVMKDGSIFDAVEESGVNNKSYLRPWKQFDVVSTTKSLVSKGVGTNIVDMVNGVIDDITLDIVLSAAEEKDELAEDLVKRSALALGVRIAYLVNMFDTNIVVLGGGINKKEGDFVGSVRESSRKFLKDKLVDGLEIVSSTLGEQSSSIGAAFLGRRELFMEV